MPPPEVYYPSDSQGAQPPPTQNIEPSSPVQSPTEAPPIFTVLPATEPPTIAPQVPSTPAPTIPSTNVPIIPIEPTLEPTLLIEPIPTLPPDSTIEPTSLGSGDVPTASPAVGTESPTPTASTASLLPSISTTSQFPGTTEPTASPIAPTTEPPAPGKLTNDGSCCCSQTLYPLIISLHVCLSLMSFLDGTIPIPASDFSIEYDISGQDATQEQFQEAADVTLDYYDEMFTEAFEMNEFVSYVSITGSTTGNNGSPNDPAIINYEIIVYVDEEETLDVPDQDLIDSIIVNAGGLNRLKEKLASDLPASNPFSGTVSTIAAPGPTDNPDGSIITEVPEFSEERRVEPAPFSITYTIPTDAADLTEADFLEASKVTADFLNSVFSDTFEFNPFTVLLASSVTQIGNSGTTKNPPSIGFQPTLLFTPSSAQKPMPEVIDGLIENVFKEPAVSLLLEALSETDGPFSGTTQVEYDKMDIEISSNNPFGKGGVMVTADDNNQGGQAAGDDADDNDSATESTRVNPLTYVGAFIAGFVFVAVSVWLYSSGRLHKILGKSPSDAEDGQYMDGKVIDHTSRSSSIKYSETIRSGGSNGGPPASTFMAVMGTIPEEYNNNKSNYHDNINHANHPQYRRKINNNVNNTPDATATASSDKTVVPADGEKVENYDNDDDNDSMNINIYNDEEEEDDDGWNSVTTSHSVYTTD